MPRRPNSEDLAFDLEALLEEHLFSQHRHRALPRCPVELGLFITDSDLCGLPGPVAARIIAWKAEPSDLRRFADRDLPDLVKLHFGGYLLVLPRASPDLLDAAREFIAKTTALGVGILGADELERMERDCRSRAMDQPEDS